MNKRYLLIITPIDKYNNTINLKKIPDANFINDKQYIKDKNISNGFVGFLWGWVPSTWFSNLKNLKWAVIKIEQDDYLQRIYSHPNLYKYKHGTILYKGDIKDVKKYIQKLRFKTDEYRKDFYEEANKCIL
ncbi:MAG: hypothetical protein ACOCP8_10200 [archaeon]